MKQGTRPFTGSYCTLPDGFVREKGDTRLLWVSLLRLSSWPGWRECGRAAVPEDDGEHDRLSALLDAGAMVSDMLTASH